MTFSIYQDQAIRTAKLEGFKFNIGHAALGISGEAGEFADCVKKYLIYNQSLDRKNAAEELGDLLWYIALACDSLGISMADVATQNIEKLAKRYPEKYTDLHAQQRLDKNESN